MPPLCRFFAQGHCRNGANCRFEHPGVPTNQNPFTKPQDGTNPFRITTEMMRIDLADERPPWILSCYGPGKDAPEQLFGGYPREQSLEEVMVYIRGSANQQQAISEVTGLYNQAEQQIQASLRNLDGALDFILAAENKQPNRIDICKQNTLPGGTTGVFAVRADNTTDAGGNKNPFSTPAPANPFGGGGGGGGGGPTFGQPSMPGQKPNPFGAPAAPQFGQPSVNSAAVPAFGQPTPMGASAPAPAFGQPTKMGAGAPAFGQPSVIQRPNPFSASSAPAPSPFSQVGQPTFGQPSTIGQPVNPFGAPAQAPAPANPFSQPSAPASGASPFAQVPQGTTSNASPFGQPAASNPFARPAASDVSMDTSTPGPAPNNPFGQPPSTGATFGQPSQPSGAANPNPFGAPQNPAHPLRNVVNQGPAAGGPKPGPYAPGSTKQHPPPESYMTKAMNGQLGAFRGRPIVYKWKVGDRYQDQPPENPTLDQQVPGIRRPDGLWTKIMFPNGPPAYNKDTEPDPSLYTDTIKAAYAQMAAAGRFQGDMPEVPPMREDCVWTF